MAELEKVDPSVGINSAAAPALPSFTQKQKETASTPDEQLKYLREVNIRLLTFVSYVYNCSCTLHEICVGLFLGRDICSTIII